MAQVFIYRSSDDTSQPGIHLRCDTQVITGEQQFTTAFGTPTSLERDLLLIGASIFCADRGIARGEREDFARIIELSIPIVNIGLLQPLTADIEDVLRLLSNDLWRIRFRQEPGGLEEPTTRSSSDGGVLLFSGGLDSLAAALEFGAQSDLALVSHVTMSQQTRNTQLALVSLLEELGLTVSHLQFFVSSRGIAGFDHDIESSQRTRSFMFLILAALVARREGRHRILMIAENGQLAIHLPLNSARIAAFSTHTAHPDVLEIMQRILSKALSVPFELSNPYVARTKAEVISRVCVDLPAAIPVSNSCWRSTRLPQGASHCGECVPCCSRVAVETYGPDPTQYARDLFQDNFAAMGPDDEGRRNLADLCEFAKRFEIASDADLYDEWPELYSANINATSTIAMYRRAAAETRAVLSRYAGLAPALQ